MPRRGSPYGGAYAREIEALKRVPHLCELRHEGCTGRALSLDHQPPLALHRHVEGSGCCRRVPSCLACNLKAGSWRVANVKMGRRSSPPPRQVPPASRVW